MCFNHRVKFLSLIIATLVPLCINEACEAQIITGKQTNTRVIQKKNQFLILGGKKVNRSKFHRFKEFSLRPNQSAIFQDNKGINNIFALTTGRQSIISGTLGVKGKANLIFINPRGINFLGNSRLDLAGNFLGTTAKQVNFKNGDIFNRTALPQNVSASYDLVFSGNERGINVRDTPSINSQIPIAGNTPFRLENFNATSSENPQQANSISFLGNGIVFNSGLINNQKGGINIGSVNTGTVKIDTTGSQDKITYSKNTDFSNIRLNNSSQIDSTGIFTSVTIDSEILSLDNNSNLSVTSFAEAPGDGITINSKRAVNLSGFSQGEENNSIIWTNTLSGKGPDITVRSQKFNANSAGIIISSAGGENATGGSISVTSDQDLIVTDLVSNDVSSINNLPSLISGVISIAFGPGNKAGNLVLDTTDLNIKDAASIGSFAFLDSESGNIDVSAKNIVLSGSDPNSALTTRLQTYTGGAGAAGSITIQAENFDIQDGGTVGSFTLSDGNAGNVEIDVNNSLTVSGKLPGSDNRNRSKIASAAQFQLPRLRRIFNLPETNGFGDAGQVKLTAKTITIDKEAEVSVQNDGLGGSGRLVINTDQLLLKEGGNIIGSIGRGEGGSINVNARQLLLIDDSQITASAINNAVGGNIQLNAKVFAANQSQITANADQGNGGTVTIQADTLITSQNNTVTATSNRGAEFNGAVEINQNQNQITFPNNPNLNNQPTQLESSNCTSEGSSISEHGSGHLFRSNKEKQIYAQNLQKRIDVARQYTYKDSVTGETKQYRRWMGIQRNEENELELVFSSSQNKILQNLLSSSDKCSFPS